MSPLEEQPKTFGCHHFSETCGNCEGMVRRWKAERSLLLHSMVDDVSAQLPGTGSIEVENFETIPRA